MSYTDRPLYYMHDMDLVLVLCQLVMEIASTIFIWSLYYSFRILEAKIYETLSWIQHSRWAALVVIYLQCIHKTTNRKVNCFKMSTYDTT